MGLLDVLTNDLSAMLQELPVPVKFNGQQFLANRSAYHRDNMLGEGGFMNTSTMTIVAAYSKITQEISLGDIVEIAGRKFRIVGADLSSDAVSVDFSLEDINK
jgi:hypothetical protein